MVAGTAAQRRLCWDLTVRDRSVSPLSIVWNDTQRWDIDYQTTSLSICSMRWPETSNLKESRNITGNNLLPSVQFEVLGSSDHPEAQMSPPVKFKAKCLKSAETEGWCWCHQRRTVRSSVDDHPIHTFMFINYWPNKHFSPHTFLLHWNKQWNLTFTKFSCWLHEL